MTATTDIQFIGGAANDLDVGHLICRDAAQLGAARVFLAGDALAVDQNFIGAGTDAAAIPTTTATIQGQSNPRYAVDHVINRNRGILAEEVRFIDYGGSFQCLYQGLDVFALGDCLGCSCEGQAEYANLDELPGNTPHHVKAPNKTLSNSI